MRRLRILTWATRLDYLRCLAQTSHELIVVSSGQGRPDHGDFPPNVHPIGGEEARRQKVDLVLFQRPGQYLDEQYELLSAAQRRLPKVYLEHEPPQEHPVDSRHVVTDAGVPVVHVSHFNRLMWDHGHAATRVIEPGVPAPQATYSGALERGLAVIEHVTRRRALGIDVFEEASKRAALDLAFELDPPVAGSYRYFFFPARYASPTLSLIRAMMIGMPVLALATGGIAGVVRHGIDGFVEADPARLVERMNELAGDRQRAALLGEAAREHAVRRFGIARFVAEWNHLLTELTQAPGERRAA
ncbi:MAG TPA: glycosyltransferase [Burkholderiales bacterium]|nr:glycosyltransferase [Burkholderiales bacterium]